MEFRSHSFAFVGSRLIAPHSIWACWALLRVHFDIVLYAIKATLRMLIEIRSSRHVELATLNITITIKTKLLIHGLNFEENKCLDATVSNVECDWNAKKVVRLCCRRIRNRSVAHQTSSVLQFTLCTLQQSCMRSRHRQEQPLWGSEEKVYALRRSH